MPSYSKVANGNIEPAHAVKLDVTDVGRVLQAGAGEDVYGISGPGTRYTPFPGLDDGYHAIAGENCQIYGAPDKDVLWVLGGTVTVADRLKSDANGEAVTASTDKDKYCAFAMESGVAGETVRVQLVASTERSSS